MNDLEIKFTKWLECQNVEIKHSSAEEGFNYFIEFYKATNPMSEFYDIMFYSSGISYHPQITVNESCEEKDLEQIVLDFSRRIYLDVEKNSFATLNLSYFYSIDSLKKIDNYQSDWCTSSFDADSFLAKHVAADSNFKALKSLKPVQVYLVTTNVII